ncbi:hypothetical protein LguiB_006999 [Lonicera macranthoides]
MSRREDRDSESKRHRSRFDRESSPKRPRREGKPATERPENHLKLGNVDHSDQNQNHRSRVPHSVLLEAPLAPDHKVETGSVDKESDSKSNGHHEGIKRSSDPTAVPRSRSFFQHDERDMAGQLGRSSTRREATDRGWWRDSKNLQGERETSKTVTSNTQQKNEKPRVRGEDDNNNAWRHDGFFEMEAGQKPPARKRPSFREKKIQADSETVDKSAAKTEPVKPIHSDHPPLASERREERESHNPRHREERERHNPRHSDRPGKPVSGYRDSNRSGPLRSNFSPRDRYTGGGNNRGREGFGERQGFRQSGVRVEKWKHDLYDEANRSPTPKNEEDQIAKVEALLSS